MLADGGSSRSAAARCACAVLAVSCERVGRYKCAAGLCSRCGVVCCLSSVTVNLIVHWASLTTGWGCQLLLFLLHTV